jgi:hypothetical protein
VSGLFTADAWSRYREKRDSFPVSRSELDDAQGAARTFFVVTGVLGAATVVSAGLATYVTLSRDPPPSEPKRGVSGVRVGLGPAGLAIAGEIP